MTATSCRVHSLLRMSEAEADAAWWRRILDQPPAQATPGSGSIAILCARVITRCAHLIELALQSQLGARLPDERRDESFFARNEVNPRRDGLPRGLLINPLNDD